MAIVEAPVVLATLRAEAFAAATTTAAAAAVAEEEAVVAAAEAERTGTMRFSMSARRLAEIAPAAGMQRVASTTKAREERA